MIAPLHLLSACSVVVASSWPSEHRGKSFASIVPAFPASRITSSRAGGWLPSAVAILPLAWKETGASSCLGRVVGDALPFKVRITFPERTTTGFSPPALATVASTAKDAIVTAAAQSTGFLISPLLRL